MYPHYTHTGQDSAVSVVLNNLAESARREFNLLLILVYLQRYVTCSACIYMDLFCYTKLPHSQAQKKPECVTEDLFSMQGWTNAEMFWQGYMQ